MFACKVHHLRYLGFCDLIRIDAAFADAVVVDMQHYSCGGFVVLSEEAFQNMHDELHRRVIVVENEDPVHVRPLGLRLGLGDDRSARPALVVATLAIIVGHTGGAQFTDRQVSLCKGESHVQSIAYRVAPWPRRHVTTNIIKTSAQPFQAANSREACPVPGQGVSIRTICRGQEEIAIA